VRDLSEQRRLEGALRHAQKMEAIGRLAGGVAHDFNNLLTVITSFSTLLSEARPVEDPDRGILDEIRGAADRGATLTRQLLALSRKQVLAPRMLSINETIRNLEKILKRLVGNEVAVQLSLDESVPNVFADPGQLEQVLINLCANARDAMQRGGNITITTTTGRPTDVDKAPSDSWMHLTVTDTGDGMSHETLEQIFEPFFTTKGEDRGTGLGLSIVHGIITQSGGTIHARSELGQGTTFQIELPPYEVHAPAMPA
jgi:signal transduction histidine kinase